MMPSIDLLKRYAGVARRALAGALMASISVCASAVGVAGNYVGQENGQAVSVVLRGDGELTGALSVNGIDIPLAGREAGGRIEGAFRDPSGRSRAFTARVEGGTLSITMDGNTLVLKQQGAAAAPPAAGNPLDTGGATPAGNPARETARNPLDTPAGANPLDPPARPRADGAPARNAPRTNRPETAVDRVAPPPPARIEAQPTRGEIFSYDLPRGWQKIEDSNEIKIFSPDGAALFGFCGVEGSQMPNGAAFLRQMAAGGKWADVQIHSGVRLGSPRGTEMTEYLVSYTFNRVPYRAWVRTATVFGAGGFNNNYMLYTSAVNKAFDTYGGELYRLACIIQVFNQQLVFQRAHRNVVLNQGNLNRPMDHSAVTDGYWKQQKSQGDVLARGSDVRRDSYAITIPETGERRHVGQAAFDPALGGVPDPNNPGRILPLDPHWQGR